MEVLTTLGEQVGCALALARMSPQAVESINHAELVLSSSGVRPRMQTAMKTLSICGVHRRRRARPRFGGTALGYPVSLPHIDSDPDSQ